MKQNVQFDADTLLILAKVIELKSLSAAASVLGIPRSTVSRKIIKLEEDLGIKLLRKNTRQISVTDLGARIYTHAINIQNEISMVRAVLGGSKEEPQGTVRVAIPVFLGAEFASKIGISFLKKYPKAKLEIRLMDTTVHPVKDGYDVTLAYGPLQDSTLVGRKLFDVESLLCATPEFIKNINQKITHPSQLEEHPFIDAGQDSGTLKLHLQKGNKHYELSPPVRAQANNFHIGKQYVLQGFGIGALPKYGCLHELAEGRLVPILQDWSLKSKEVHVIYPFQLSFSNLVKAFYLTALDVITGTMEGGDQPAHREGIKFPDLR